MASGTHVVKMYASEGAAAVDVSCSVTAVGIHHGRDDASGQPEACSCTLDMLTRPWLPMPAVAEIGALVRVTTTTPGGTFDRFYGRITDMAVGWDEAGEATPDSGVVQVVAIGLLADLGRRVVGDAPFPQELDGARVSRVMQLAGVTLDPAYSDPGTVQIIARDIDSQPALDVAQDAAKSASGIIWEGRAGQIRYADAMHRKGIQSSLTLDACDVLVTPTWRRATEGLVNEVSIGYGVAPDGGEQPRYVDSRADSVARFGRYGYSVTTELAALADATQLGQMLLVRNSFPEWVMSALPVNIEDLDAARYDQLLALDMHSLITLTGMPVVGSSPGSAVLWVEGWKEDMAYGSHELELIVSGYCRTSPAPRWNDVDPAWLWGGQTLTEQRRNLCPNPSFETGTGLWATAPSYWTNAGATLSTDTSWKVAGAQSAKVVCDGAANQQGATITITGLAANTAYMVSATIRADSGRPIWLRVRDAVNLVNAATTGVVAVGQTQRVSVPITTGANPATLLIGISTDLTAGASTFHVDGVLVEKGTTLGAYFDGDTPDVPNQFDYAWVSTPGGSASVLSTIASIAGGVPPSLTWDSASCFGPPANLGRWDDQPATLRWDQVPASQTWDTFIGV